MDDSEEDKLTELSFEETRVLGSLIEKELTTPELQKKTRDLREEL